MIDVAVADAGHLKFIDKLQRANAEELSFYPLAVFERELPLGRILLAKVNAEPAGYIYHGAFSPILKIHQACIEYDLRGQLYGAALVRFLEKISQQFGVMSITLRCGSDISANGFWSAMGFYCQSVAPGGVRRMRDINSWRRDLSPALFVTNMDPSSKKQDASIWRKGKGEKKSQFMRGSAMQQYRKLVIERSEEK